MYTVFPCRARKPEGERERDGERDRDRQTGRQTHQHT